MGFYIRKSINAGPFGFNLSNSGIGVSAGVKGFRVGTGPRGNYVHMGVGGVYYRSTLPPKIRLGNQSGSNSSYNSQLPASTGHGIFEEIESGSVLQMQDSSSAELLQEINKKQKITVLWPTATFVGIIFLFLAFSSGVSPWLMFVLGIPYTVLIALLKQVDDTSKSTILFYELDSVSEANYQRLHDSFDLLKSCSKIWHVSSKAQVYDWKRNAGAGSLMRRASAVLVVSHPPYIKTNLDIPAIHVGKQILYFFPDRLLVYEAKNVGAIAYCDLDISINSTRFIEDQTVPRDTVTIDHTWRYVNKGGGPDRRFSNNRQIPIVLYEAGHFQSPSGLNALLHFSKQGAAPAFRDSVRHLAASVSAVPKG